MVMEIIIGIILGILTGIGLRSLQKFLKYKR